MSTPAKQELRDLIAAKLAEHSGLFNDLPIVPELADAVAGLFYRVEDDWDRIDVTSLGKVPGSEVLDQRSLVAWVPRESRQRNLAPDRTVTP